MQDWRDIYNSRLCTAEEAVKNIKPGERVFIEMACGHPEHLIKAMVDNANQYKDVHIMHGVTLGKAEYAKPEYAGKFTYDGLFLSGSTRRSVNEGRADVYPNYFFELPQMMEDGIFPIDVFFVQTTPPDEYGYCSVGTIGDVIRQAVGCSRKVMAQINDQVPWTYGDNLIHVSDMDHIVEYNEPLPISPPPKITDIEMAIGKNCAELIEDGATLQLGIGAIPDAVCRALFDKKDLGIHSEMFSDGVMELYKAGVITNKKKSFSKGKMTAAFIMGTKELYDFIDRNPAVEISNVADCNNPFEVAKCANLVSINSCTEVDIMGQVVSGTSGERQISGTGGQMDFVRGANMSLDGKGKAVIAMTSTREKNGVVTSRIVPIITHGSSVTLTRQDVNYVVTEYGIAQLRGKSLKDRAGALIAITHPDFRQPLMEEYEKRFNIPFE